MPRARRRVAGMRRRAPLWAGALIAVVTLAAIGRYRAGETDPQRGAIVDVGDPCASAGGTQCYPETILLRVGLDGHLACFDRRDVSLLDTLSDGTYFTLDTDVT